MLKWQAALIGTANQHGDRHEELKSNPRLYGGASIWRAHCRAVNLDQRGRYD